MSGIKQLARVTVFGAGNKKGESFSAERDIPSLAGKVVLITGAAGDLGRQTAVELARYGRPARIYIADLPRDEAAKKQATDRVLREAYDAPPPALGKVDGKKTKNKSKSKSKTTAAVAPVPPAEKAETSPRSEVYFLDCDLGSFDSIQKCAAELTAREQYLDIAILNAGVLSVKPWTTAEGYECHFGINYVGHALLSRLLIPVLLRTKEAKPTESARLVVVSSEGHFVTPKGGIQFDNLKDGRGDLSWNQRYGQSKLALTCMTRDLAARHPQLTVAAVHPGRISTGMGTSLVENSRLIRMAAPLTRFMTVPVTIGIQNHLWAATSPKVVSGSYYEPVGVLAEGSAPSRDQALIEKLRVWTDEQLEGRDVLGSEV